MVEQAQHALSPLGTTSGSTAGGTSASQRGVDLFQLERLRVLVRYEFVQELNKDELVDALVACHNNTHEAYHLLKERRRLARIAAATGTQVAMAPTSEASAAASSTSSSGASNHSNSMHTGTIANGLKRRNEADEVGDDIRSKRPRSLGLPELLTQRTQVFDVDVVPSGEEASAKDSDLTVSDVDSVHARELLDSAVSGTPPIGPKWATSVLSALHVAPDSAFEEQLELVADALRNALKHVVDANVASVRHDGVTQIMEILLDLPRHDQQAKVFHFEPADTELDAMVCNVETSYHVAVSDLLKMQARSQAAQNAISTISDACSACLKRMEAVAAASKEARAQRRHARAKVRQLSDRLVSHLEQSRRDLESSEREMADAAVARRDCTSAVRRYVDKRRQEFIAEGDDDVSAEVVAYMEAITSSADDCVRRRRDIEDNDQRLLSRKREVMRANTRLEFYQTLHVLLESVCSRVEKWLQATATQFQAAQSASNSRIGGNLIAFVPKLTHALRLYYEFHTFLQQRAHADKETKEQEREEHFALYENDVPSTTEAIDKAIKEYTGVIIRSTQRMREVATSQSGLWEGKRHLLPPKVFEVIVTEYGLLWTSLSGGAKDMMRDCVALIQGSPSAGVSLVPAVLHNGSIRVSSDFKVESSCTGKNVLGNVVTGIPLLSQHNSPILRGATPPSVPLSPVVDLTGDEDGTAEVGGFMDRVDFDPDSTRVTRVFTGAFDVPMSDASQAAKQSEEAQPMPPGSHQQNKQAHEFGVGDVLYTKMSIGDEPSRFVRGRVDKLMDDGSYWMEYDDGDQFQVPREYLFTQNEIETYLQSNDAQSGSGDGKCAIM